MVQRDIIPAILTDDPVVLAQQIRAAERFAPLLHIDITDGRFVPHRSVAIADIEHLHPTIPFELHLMVQDPGSLLPDVQRAAPVRVIVHKHEAGDLMAIFRAIAGAGIESSIAVSPATLTMDMAPFLSLVRQITFVAVEPGAQGNLLIPGVLQKARAFCAEHGTVPVEIDGGLKAANIQQAIATGAQRFVVGSGIWQAGDPSASYRMLQEQLSHAFP